MQVSTLVAGLERTNRVQFCRMDNPIKVDREIMSGAPCFAGTRVPVQTLFDYISHGHPLDEFLEDFPTVSREQVLAVLKLAGETVKSTAGSAA